MQFAENISNAISWESSQCCYPKNRKYDEKFIVQAVSNSYTTLKESGLEQLLVGPENSSIPLLPYRA